MELKLKDQSLQGIVDRMQAAGAARDVLAKELIELALQLDMERDARRALARLEEQRDNRLQGEIAERSQRQLEITGWLAALERDMKACIETLRQPHECKAERGMATPFEDTRIAELERELANARADAQVHQGARQALEQWEAEVRTALGVGPADSRKWMAAEIARLAAGSAAVRSFSQNSAKVRDLEAQVAALQKAIDDVWTLVEQPDGYGSPFWSEPGLDDTTPAQAVERVLAHLRSNVVQRSDDYTDELTEALRYARRSITWSRGLDLVRETILQRNGARQQVETQATALTQAWNRIRVLEERNATQAQTIAQYQAEPLHGAHREAMAALNEADRQSDDDQICGC